MSADLIEGIPFVSAVSRRILPGVAAYLTESIASELDDAERIEHAGCVLGVGHR